MSQNVQGDILFPTPPLTRIDRRSGRKELRPLGVGRGPRNGSLGSVQHPGILMCRWVRGWGFGVPFHAQWGSALLEQLGLAFSSTSSSVRNGEGELSVFPVFPWALGSYREDLCTHSTFLFSEEAGSGEPSLQPLHPLSLGLPLPTRPWPLALDVTALPLTQV